MPAAPLNIGMVQILQGHNPSFLGDLLGKKVKLVPILVPILNEGGQKSKSKTRYVPLGCPWSCIMFFILLTISFFSTNNTVLSHPMTDWYFFLRGRGGGFRFAAGFRSSSAGLFCMIVSLCFQWPVPRGKFSHVSLMARSTS